MSGFKTVSDCYCYCPSQSPDLDPTENMQRNVRVTFQMLPIQSDGARENLPGGMRQTVQNQIYNACGVTQEDASTKYWVKGLNTFGNVLFV